MNKRTFFCALLAAAFLGAQGTPVTPRAALARALDQQDTRAALRVKASGMKLERTFESASGTPAAYLFSSSDAAILLPADDIAMPVLGYIDNISGEEVPPQFRWWIDEYARQIAYATEHPAGFAAGTVTETPDREPIAPLLTTVWNQSTPFNDYCPLEGDRRTPTGCLATALAQIMNYWEYPAEPTGAITYTDSDGHVRSCSFDGRPFRWEDMLDNYNSIEGSTSHITEENASAVAWLMQAAGHASQMRYNVMGSGAYTFNMVPAVKRYFHYNPAAIQLQRDYYSAEVWDNLIYEHLSKVGPVFYTGANFNNMGHAFVCDGYRGDGYFHINWGWGGTYDGYFLLSALTPEGQGIGGHAGGYNYQQEVVFNLTPPDHPTIDIPEESPVTLAGNLTLMQFGKKQLVLSSDEAAYMPGALYNAGSETVRVVIGLKATDSSTGETTYVTDETVHTLAYHQGISRLEFTPELPQGTYKAALVVKVNDKDWTPPAHPASKTDYITLTIGATGNIIVADAPTTAEISVSSLTLDTGMYWATPYRISFTLSTKSDLQIKDTLQPMFYYDSYDLAASFARSDEIPVSFTSPGSRDMTVTTSMQVLMEEEYHGQAYLGLLSLNSGRVLAEIPVDIKPHPGAASLEMTTFYFDGDADSADPSALRFKWAVSCNAGYYAGPISIYLYRADDAEEEETLVGQFTSSEVHFLSAGQTAQADVTCTLSSAAPGEKYHAYLSYYDNTGNARRLTAKPIVLTIRPDISGICAPSASAPSADGIYDLCGRRLRSAAAPGLYILNGRKVLLK